MWGSRLVCVAVAVVLLAGCGGGREPDEAPTTVPRGSSAQTGGLTITVKDAWTRRTIGQPDRPFSYHEPRGIWLVVLLRVENEGSESARFDSMHQHLLIDGRDYSANSMASDDIDRKFQGAASMNPGFGEDITVAFDVPREEVIKPLVLQVRGSDFGSRAALMAVPSIVGARN